MERLKIREIIQTNGKELYERLGKTRKDLQYLAGELMTGNEERVLFNSKSQNLLTIESQDIIDHGFTKNQIIFLESIENIIKHFDVPRIKDECKMCIKFADKSCLGTDYWRTQEHYYCIQDWKSFKEYNLNTRFVYIKTDAQNHPNPV